METIIAQGLLEPSFLRGNTLVTRAAEDKSCNWGMQVDWCVAALRCVRPQFQWYQLTYATEIKSMQLYDSIVGLSQKIVSSTFTFTFTFTFTSQNRPSHFFPSVTLPWPWFMRSYNVVAQTCQCSCMSNIVMTTDVRVGWMKNRKSSTINRHKKNLVHYEPSANPPWQLH